MGGAFFIVLSWECRTALDSKAVPQRPSVRQVSASGRNREMPRRQPQTRLMHDWCRWRLPAPLFGLRVGRDHGHRPAVALGDHAGRGCRIFLEMVGGAMGLEGRFIVVDFVKQEVVLIAREVKNVEPAATRLLDRSHAV